MKRSFIFLFLLCFSKLLLAQADLTTLVEKCSPSIFFIFMYDKDDNVYGTATGFFISSSGIALSNHHVFEDAYKVVIKTNRDKYYIVEKILAWSESSDLLKFKVKNELNESFPYLKISTTTPKLGEKIFTIGNPENLEQTVADGIVSSIRNYDLAGEFIQFTAPSSHGSSGSPLMNMKGEVLGVVSGGKEEGENLNFATSIKNLNNLEGESGNAEIISTVSSSSNSTSSNNVSASNSSEGCISGNCVNGSGTLKYSNGDQYIGNWNYGKKNGHGILVYSNGARYDGQWYNDLKNGRGTFIFVNGDKYEGEWKNGKRYGQGTYTKANGESHTGEWKDDAMVNSNSTSSNSSSSGCISGNCNNGSGTKKYDNGDKYIGKWSNGVRNGQGIFYYNNGDKYEGEWYNGKMNGQGTYTKANGETHSGNWKDNNFISSSNNSSNTIQIGCVTGDCTKGYGTKIYSNGDKYIGEWYNGLRNGRGSFYYINGDIYEGNWTLGKMNGIGTYTKANGEKHIGEWKNGALVK